MSLTRVNTVAELVAALATLPQDLAVLAWPRQSEAAYLYGLVPVVVIHQSGEGGPTEGDCVILEPATEFSDLFNPIKEWLV